MRHVLVTIGAAGLAAVTVAARVGAQGGAPPAGAAAPLPPPAERQIAGAVLPLPEVQRAGATVLGYGADGKLTTLRQGTNDFICLADEPEVPGYHASCYHKGLEPFMARGRELRAQGKRREEVDSVRRVELRQGRYAIPQNAALYQLFADAANYDPATGVAKSPRSLYVIYTPNATAESTGLSATPIPGGPWIMYPGTPVAHIMISPPPRPATP